MSVVLTVFQTSAVIKYQRSRIVQEKYTFKILNHRTVEKLTLILISFLLK